jgi:hypothetical protein
MSHSKQSNLLLCKKCKYKKEREEDNMSSSEVAQLRSRIAAEIQAMNRALYGYAEVARHQIIDQKYCQLGIYQDQLTKILGQRATDSSDPYHSRSERKCFNLIEKSYKTRYTSREIFSTNITKGKYSDDVDLILLMSPLAA